VTRAEAYEEQIGSVAADVAFQGSELLLNNVTARIAGGQLSGAAALDLQTKLARLDAKGEGLSLQAIQAVQTRTDATGLVDVSVTGTGSVERPDFHVAATSPQIAIGKHVFEQVSLTGDLKDDSATFQLGNVFQGRPFQVTGLVGLRSPYTIDAAMNLDETPLAPYVALAGRDLPNLTGVLNGRVTVQGPLERPEDLLAKADLSQLRLEVQNYHVANTEPIHASYTAGVLQIPRVTFRGPQTEIQLEGNLRLKGARSICEPTAT
jgi:autotransporter translocation and assembly factor TamB